MLVVVFEDVHDCLHLQPEGQGVQEKPVFNHGLLVVLGLYLLTKVGVQVKRNVVPREHLVGCVDLLLVELTAEVLVGDQGRE